MFLKTSKSLRSSLSCFVFYNIHKHASTLPSAPIGANNKLHYHHHQQKQHQQTRSLRQHNYSTATSISFRCRSIDEQRRSCVNQSLLLFLNCHCRRHFHFINRRNSTTQYSSQTIRKMLNHLPFFACGKIVAGFGRGSKDLGIPTANYPLDVVKSLPDAVQPGVYYGWANVDNGPVYKMVMSIGWNPFYDNKEKSMETHILHNFNRDLYDSQLKVCIVGYLRPEQNFKSLDDLIAYIKQDIAQAEDFLETNESHKNLQNHEFFLDNNGCVNSEKNDVQS